VVFLLLCGCREAWLDNGIDVSIWFWVAFNAGVLAILALDLGLFHKHAHAPSVREAATWSAVWVALSLAFAAFVFVYGGPQPGFAFLTGYVVEYSLSVDNIFVIVLIFAYFGLPAAYQHRVLFYGILGALVMRGALIGAGSVLLARFDWVIYVFGALLIASGVKMARQKHEQGEVGDNFAVKLFRRVLPVTSGYRGQRFLVREHGVLMATPLLLALVVVEATDLLFAFDSIPAIFAVTQDPFLVYTSNVCAILGLRSLYFLLAGVVTKFRFLSLGLAVLLVWVGTKMLISDLYHVPIPLSLAVIAGVLAAAIGASLLLPAPRSEEETQHSSATAFNQEETQNVLP
jgi:tellurite resistance protein TerC